LRKDLGVKVVQAEDEIAGISTAIGASFAGSLAATNTSGPGLALKAEAIGLAIMAELPLVIIDVMRGGPSTGLPTKTEQTDLNQALYGRNGESPLVVMAADTPANCFHYAFMASKIALEHMTPVILLTDSFIGNGTSLWKLPKLEELPEIRPHYATKELNGNYKAVTRDEETKVRYWAVPGTEGFEHRNGGLGKDYVTGAISTDSLNHEKMVETRKLKIDNVAASIPKLKIQGDADGDVLLVGWGSVYGHLLDAVEQANKQGYKTALAHFNYILPLPENTQEVFDRFNGKKIVVCELNNGQFASYLKTKISGLNLLQYNKVQGQPFTVHEIVDLVQSL
ncbi:MAG: 2-oxoacid:acceptor oxidoreductase subunit alpha, partial [Prevotellaceae bacterium]|nr:2-oxoacid:acceptor oxidoreductase subunit alpha [Prevotellaceae bacterium]